MTTETTTRPLCSFCNSNPPVIALPNPGDHDLLSDEPVSLLLLCAKCAHSWGVPTEVLQAQAVVS